MPPKVDGGGGFLGFNPIADLANSLREGVIWLLEKLATFWAQVDTPPLASGADYTPVGSVAWLQAELSWFVGAAAVLGLLLAAGRLAWQRRGEPVQDVMSGLVTLAVVTGCSVAAVTIATQAGDDFSHWIINAATDHADTKFGDLINSSLWQGAALGGPGLLIVLFLLCIMSSLAQIAMLYVRYAMLGLLVGFLPLAASLSLIPAGKAWFKKMMGWLIAFVLYKPTAATIYAYAFISMKAPDGTSQIVGIIMMIMAVLALPALMRFAVPMVSAAGGGGGGAMALGGAMGAMGARMAGRMASSGGGAGGGGGETSGEGPTGAQPVGDSGQGQQPGGWGGEPPQGAQPGQQADTPGAGDVPPQGGGAEVAQGGGAEVAQGAGTAAAGGGSGAALQGLDVVAPGLGTGLAVAKQGIDAAGDAARGAAEDSTGEGT